MRLSGNPTQERDRRELEEGYIPSSKTHVAGEALEGLHIGICSFKSGQLKELGSRAAAVELKCIGRWDRLTS